MRARNHRDIMGGGLLALLGIGVALYTHTHYAMGSFARMGPGMVPAMLGYALIFIGALIAIPGFYRGNGETIRVEWRPMAAIIAAVLGFVIVFPLFGLVPAIIVLTAISSLADGKIRPVRTLVLAVSLAVLAVLIFRVGLGVPFPLLKWAV